MGACQYLTEQHPLSGFLLDPLVPLQPEAQALQSLTVPAGALLLTHLPAPCCGCFLSQPGTIVFLLPTGSLPRFQCNGSVCDATLKLDIAAHSWDPSTHFLRALGTDLSQAARQALPFLGRSAKVSESGLLTQLFLYSPSVPCGLICFWDRVLLCRADSP